MEKRTGEKEEEEEEEEDDTDDICLLFPRGPARRGREGEVIFYIHTEHTYARGEERRRENGTSRVCTHTSRDVRTNVNRE